MELYEYPLMTSWLCLAIGLISFLLAAKLNRIDCPEWVRVAAMSLFKYGIGLFLVFIIIAVVYRMTP